MMNLFLTINEMPLEINTSLTLCLCLIAIALNIFTSWRIFTKAGQAGWKSLIPIYSNIVLFRICGVSPWKILLFLVPFMNIYMIFSINIKLAHKFGKSTFFGVMIAIFGLVPMFIIAIDDSEYQS